MTTDVTLISDLQIKDGQLAAFRALMAEMIGDAQANEPGTLDYVWSISDDGTACHLRERYADSDAALTHLATFGTKYLSRFLAVFTPVHFVVLGAPSDALRAKLAVSKPVYVRYAGGFRRS